MTGTTTQSGKTDDQRWVAVQDRNKNPLQPFIYAVRTTGVYCRPGCSSRLPSRNNVCFFENCVQAKLAGYRPCKRCRPDTALPDDPQIKAVIVTCQSIEQASVSPSINELASAVGYSASHLARVFKRVTGITPKAYASAVRMNAAKADLQNGKPVTNAIYDAGYNNSSRFYEDAANKLGMTPTQYRDGATGQTIRVGTARCYLGWVLVGATEKGICAIELGNHKAKLVEGIKKRFPNAQLVRDDQPFDDMVKQVITFLEQPDRSLSLPLDIQGTAFQQRVWEALRSLPAGATTTYSELAEKLGKPKAVRAVATACAANRIAVAIPCHRVIGKDGKLHGYYWGLDRKKKLLEREAEL